MFLAELEGEMHKLGVCWMMVRNVAYWYKGQNGLILRSFGVLFLSFKFLMHMGTGSLDFAFYAFDQQPSYRPDIMISFLMDNLRSNCCLHARARWGYIET